MVKGHLGMALLLPECLGSIGHHLMKMRSICLFSESLTAQSDLELSLAHSVIRFLMILLPQPPEHWD